ncbi:SUPPRESSOR OF GAMMA RESPONSE 1-like isoform X2 [Rhododendron vialii]|uniref:SUPPRESSOR OF GAMMA RESPONSE 1-like isoform X2 n=1 Tax=Rhododendron vialii TaxID=182163 RepID=UPI00265EDBEA|nr:SUPPRESSOR OF GAMMA RESPONSE 1-like isoform X2 [Rhododendron vialii]
MARPSWLVDSNRFATKIKSASSSCDPESVNWKSNPTRACPNCLYVIDNSDVAQAWPGLPRGVKFDPSDQEILWHLLAKNGVGNKEPHPFVDEFIPTVNEDEGICYTHPQHLPGVRQDGSASHFFHRAIKAYNTGTRKRRKIHGDDFGDVRWHKTGRTKPVIVDGVQQGCKKIMVLYVTPIRGGKAEKTNWVMHQYHIGTGEDEKEGEYVVSKVFYQQQQIKQTDKWEQNLPDDIDLIHGKVDPVTPEPPRTERRFSGFDLGNEPTITCIASAPQHHEMGHVEEKEQAPFGNPNYQEIHESLLAAKNDADQVEDNDDNQTGEDPKWWEGESQYLLNSQQLVEGLPLCDDLLQSQSPTRGENENGELKVKSCLSDYAILGPEYLKKDLVECQDLVLDAANIELDTPPEFRLSQIEFGSQESFVAWGGS